MRASGDRVVLLRVPNNNVCIAANPKHSFLGIETEQLGRIRSNQMHPAVEGEFSLIYPKVIKELESMLDTRAAVGYFGEIINPCTFLRRKEEWAVVS